jgi:PAS domain S-box-containing protein
VTAREAELEREVALLRSEVRVAREAANLTAEAVVEQFAKTESALRRLSQVSAEQRAVLDAASQVAVVATGPGGIVTLFNTGAERLLGYRASEIVGRATPVLYHLDAELVERARALEPEAGRRLGPVDLFRYLAVSGRADVHEWTLVRKDGSHVPVDESVTPLRDASGDLAGFLCVALDLTVHKRAEQEIRAAMVATEAANRTKSAFLANMSHELRTPLNAVIGYSEMLAEEAEEDGLDHFAKDLGKIRDAGKHLLGLINDVLDLSKIEAGRIELVLEDLPIEDLVGEVVRMAEPLVTKNGNTLRVERDPSAVTLHADALRVRQILFNLLSNACKFTERGEVRLAVQLEKVGASELVRFDVTDTGIGMSSTQLARLFQPFVQADASTTRKYGGTGLGLAISRQFAELMGGRVDVSSEPGRGSTFTVRLPRVVGGGAARDDNAATIIAAPASSGAPSVAPLGAKVLVIDDDPAVRELVGHHLERAGYRVITAVSGEEGLAMARAEAPAAITLDVLMPGKDGWTVLAELKSSAVTAAIPVVLLTILDQSNAGYVLGAADFLAKPVDRGRLLDTLARLVGRGGARTVLVVDDDASLRTLVASSLAREGFGVREAGDGLEALARMEEAIPSVVLLDLMMPRLDGFGFLERLRARPAWRHVPVVVLTAMDLSEADRRLLRGTVEEVVQKGDTRGDDLLAELERLVRAAVDGRGQARVV